MTPRDPWEAIQKKYHDKQIKLRKPAQYKVSAGEYGHRVTKNLEHAVRALTDARTAVGGSLPW